MMRGVQIKDLTQTEQGSYLSFDLGDILIAVGDSVHTSTWRCHNVECTGAKAGDLYKVSDEGRSIPGGELIRVISGVDQTIDGEFEAYRRGDEGPWLVVKAVDSSWFEVWSADPSILDRVRRRFREVSELRADAA